MHHFMLSQDSVSVFKKRKIILGATTTVFTAGSLLYLNQAWFKHYTTSEFHFFNDNLEWFQLDKVGHAYSNYQSARLMMQAMEWAGSSTKKQVLIGGMSGFAYMAVIEVMDGYSSGWGFSIGDVAFNALGSGMAIGQKLAWNEQRIQLKFMYYPTHFPSYNPTLLGRDASEQFLKDYNGQTYWLSINPSSFMKEDTKFPRWLNVAFGYGADGMLGSSNNEKFKFDKNGNPINFKRYRQAYFSLDFDLTKIRTKSKVLKSVFSIVSVLKIPFPNLELSDGKFKFNPY
jgi:hypothetical protein